MGRQIKYMGTADIRTVPKGTTFGGRLKEEDATTEALVFNKDNYWVVDVDEAGLTDDQVDLLVEDKETFKEVTDMKRVPVNGFQSTFLGMKSISDSEETALTTAASSTSDTATTTGGSTAGADAAGTAGGSSRSTKGSTKS